MPSPFGERVVPIIDPEMKKKAEKAAAAKESKGKRVSGIIRFIIKIIFDCAFGSRRGLSGYIVPFRSKAYYLYLVMY